MLDRALDRLCAYVFGAVDPIDHDAIDVLIDVVAQEDQDDRDTDPASTDAWADAARPLAA